MPVATVPAACFIQCVCRIVVINSAADPVIFNAPHARAIACSLPEHPE